MEKLERLHSDNISKTFKMQATERKVTKITPHWHDFYELELCLAGTGTTLINGTEYPIAPNSLFFLTPVDVHSIQAKDPVTLLNFTFSQECMEDSGFGELLALSGCIACDAGSETAAWLASLISRIVLECREERLLHQKYLSQLLSCILLELLRLQDNLYHRSNECKELQLPVQNAIYYIRAHFREPITLEDVAAFAGFSAGHMSRKLHEALGCSFRQYLTTLRLKHAERLLLYSGESVTDIAGICGFNSVSHFLHAFQAKNHISALQFRKSNLPSDLIM